MSACRCGVKLGRQRRRLDQDHRRIGAALGVQPALDLSVRGEQRHPLGELVEDQRLGREIARLVAMVVEMILAEVGPSGRREAQPVDAALMQRMARDLHHQGVRLRCGSHSRSVAARYRAVR